MQAVRREAGTLRLSVGDTQRSLTALLPFLAERGIELEQLQTHRPTLEDVFVELTRRD